MILKQYQQDAIQSLLKKSLWLLEKWWRMRNIVFKSPTWSWKTVMLQYYLKELSKIKSDYSYLWISVHDLSNQSKTSFEKHLEWSNLKFSLFDDIQDKIIHENEILFINWEKLKQRDKEKNEYKVTAMKANERNENLPIYLENTHNAWRKVILIVDESHRDLDTEKSQELVRNYIKPVLQIEVSATPDTKDPDEMVTVDIEDVIAEWMIKDDILVNEWLKNNIKNNDEETDILILNKAIEKQKELKNLYWKEWSSVDPLLLIQLPSEAAKTSELDIKKFDRVIRLLKEKFDISIENQKLAIWLSNDKTNKDLIDIKDSPIKALIFKEAIAVWWDCPRAQVLVMFREMKNFTFKIQTIWRILRMPEQKHYNEKLLNKAYVYTDLPKNAVSIHDTAKNLIKNQFWYVNNEIISQEDINNPIRLPNFYKQRTDYWDIKAPFMYVLWEVFCEEIWWKNNETFRESNKEKLWKLIELNTPDVKDELISDWKILVDIDQHLNEKITVTTTIHSNTEEELIKIMFDNFAREQVWPQFSWIARSYTVIIQSLYTVFNHLFFWIERKLYYQKLVLNNKDFFINILNKAKDKYKIIKEKEINDLKKSSNKYSFWEIPRIESFTEDSKLYDFKKNIISPFYSIPFSEPEIKFIEEFLEKNETVKFWYRNWKGSQQFFAVPYESDWNIESFYPDFIVSFKNWKIGIFDTKSWFTLKEWKGKAKWLEEYIKNNPSSNLIWGIIINRNWTFMINKKWDFNEKDPNDFMLLSEYLK